MYIISKRAYELTARQTKSVWFSSKKSCFLVFQCAHLCKHKQAPCLRILENKQVKIEKSSALTTTRVEYKHVLMQIVLGNNAVPGNLLFFFFLFFSRHAKCICLTFPIAFNSFALCTSTFFPVYTSCTCGWFMSMWSSAKFLVGAAVCGCLYFTKVMTRTFIMYALEERVVSAIFFEIFLAIFFQFFFGCLFSNKRWQFLFVWHCLDGNTILSDIVPQKSCAQFTFNSIFSRSPSFFANTAVYNTSFSAFLFRKIVCCSL